jgi:serine/threonine protein kinase
MELADDANAESRMSGVESSAQPAGDHSTSSSVIRRPELYEPRTVKPDLQRRNRLPAAECIRIGLTLTTALQHLHQHGLVHRDIKPSNIVFVRGQPKLADIGLVAAGEGTASMVGTLGYLAPEGPGTPRADLFSLGKVLYEASTGKDRQSFPEPLTQLGPADDPDLLAELNEIILKACAPDPRRRYASAAEMHAELERLQAGKSIQRGWESLPDHE